jgi:hypothetical protein
VRKRKRRSKKSPVPPVPLHLRRNFTVFTAWPTLAERPRALGRPKNKLLIDLIRAAAVAKCADRRYRHDKGPDQYHCAEALLRKLVTSHDLGGLDVRPVGGRQIKRSHLAIKRLGMGKFIDLDVLLKRLPLLIRAKDDRAIVELLHPNGSVWFSYDEP